MRRIVRYLSCFLVVVACFLPGCALTRPEVTEEAPVEQTELAPLPSPIQTPAPSPTPTPTLEPTVEPSPSPTPLPVDPYYAEDPYGFISGIEGGEGIVLFGGYEADPQVLAALQQASDELNYEHSFLMLDLNTGRGAAFNLDAVYYTASSIKGPFAASFCALAPEVAAGWESSIISMLQYSDNDAYRVLNDTYHRTYIQQWAQECGVDPAPFAWKYPHINARQMAALWLRNYEFFEQDEWGAQVGSWFESPEYSIIHETVGDLYTTRSKGGWLTDEDPDHEVSIDAGIVYADNGPYIVVIMSRVPSSLAYLGPIMEALENVHSSM